jgi:DNA (cytosine-5)-methyltransferase 1
VPLARPASRRNAVRLQIGTLSAFTSEIASGFVGIRNVPDVLNHGGQNIPEEICEVLEEKGYTCRYTLLNAALYGVPQMRERMFLIGYRQELTDRVCFPQPSHWVKLPAGYADSRAAALKLLNRRDPFATAHHYVETPLAIEKPYPAVTAEQAIGDLPPILARYLPSSGELPRAPPFCGAPCISP